MERNGKEIRVPSVMYDVWENAYREELKRRHPNDYQQVPVIDAGSSRENFVFRGIVFSKAGE